MREENGSFHAKEDRSGARYYLHRLAEDPRPAADLPPRPGPEAKRADADTLHDVYSAMLENLTLGQEHRQGLQRRGLSDDAIERGGYRSLRRKGRAGIASELREQFG